jgi:EAL domain-containing protein (putative c-di-GMP-specific phosphodiesterase class I)
VRELDVAPLAEGIESPEEAAVCRDLGFQLFQGYHFGRPAAASQYFGAPAAPH